MLTMAKMQYDTLKLHLQTTQKGIPVLKSPDEINDVDGEFDNDPPWMTDYFNHTPLGDFLPTRNKTEVSYSN